MAVWTLRTAASLVLHLGHDRFRDHRIRSHDHRRRRGHYHCHTGRLLRLHHGLLRPLLLYLSRTRLVPYEETEEVLPNIAKQTSRTIRTSFTVGYFVSSLVLCYLVNHFPPLANTNPGAQDHWVPMVARILVTMCSYLFLGLTLLHLTATTIGIVGSNEKFAIWSYSRGDSLKDVNFRDLVNRRTRLEQASGYYPESNPVEQSMKHGVSVHAPVAKVLPTQHQRLRSNPPRAPEQRQNLTLFVRCGCCLDTNDLIPLLPPVRPTYLARIASRHPKHEAIELKVAAWSTRREQALRARAQSLQGLADENDQDVGVEHHELCQTCRYFAYNLHRISPPTTTRGHDYLYALRRGFSCSPRDFKVLEHAACPQDLAQSSRNCHFCNILWNALSPEQKAQLLGHDANIVAQNMLSNSVQEDSPLSGPETALHHARCIRIAVEWNERRMGRMVVHYGGLRRPRRWLRIPRGQGADTVAAFLNIQTGLEHAPSIRLFRPEPCMTDIETAHKSTGSEDTIQLVQRWLQGLLIVHGSPASWMPSRVLDVSGEDPTAVRVVKRESVDRNGDLRYVALSHCWGVEQFLTYNNDTAVDINRGISLSRLAKTFQEAIDFTRRLRIRYIWIDSLCILQGNDADWEREAPTMCRVYMSAYLTIASVASWSATEGLYREQDPLQVSGCLLDITNRVSLCAEPIKDERDGNSPLNELSWSKWQTRGWTLQEDLLSPRIVFFASKSIAFESKDVAAGYTSGSVVLPSALDRWELRGYLPGVRDRPAPDWHTQWWIWVRKFTMRRLTNENDRAYGILGLAEYLLTCEAFESPFERRYLAGLWEPSLVSGLLWFVNVGTTKRPGYYRAPSWSWVSVDGGIDNGSLSATGNTGLEIERVNAVPAANLATNEDPLQLVARLETDSYIQVRGKIRTLTWRSDEEYYYHSDKENLDFRNFPDLDSNATLGLIPSASTQNVGPRCYPMFVDGTEECVGWLVPDTTSYFNSQEPLHCLQISVEPETQAERQDFRKAWITRGIALRPISRDGIDGNAETIPSFERLGFFELERKSTGVYLPMDGYGPADLRSYILRAQPEVDPHGVFRGCEPRSIRIY